MSGLAVGVMAGFYLRADRRFGCLAFLCLSYLIAMLLAQLYLSMKGGGWGALTVVEYLLAFAGGALLARSQHPRRALALPLVFLVAVAFHYGITRNLAILPRFSGNQIECRSHLHNLDAAIHNFQQDNGKLPDSLDHLVPKYLSVVPECPSRNRYILKSSAELAGNEQPDDKRWELQCLGEGHLSEGIPSGYPRLSSHEGLTLGTPTRPVHPSSWWYRWEK